MKYVVQIRDENDVVVKEFKECDSRRSAEQLERGVNINLNHDLYYTYIEEVG